MPQISMGKRGQVSIFVIAGLVVVAIIGLMITLSPKLDFSINGQATVEDLNAYMESCVKDIIESSFGKEGFGGSAEQAEMFLIDYIKQRIRTNCESEIDKSFNNVEKPNDIFVEVDVEEADFSGWIVSPADHVYERIIVKINYEAKVNIEGNKFTLKPILVEYEP